MKLFNFLLFLFFNRCLLRNFYILIKSSRFLTRLNICHGCSASFSLVKSIKSQVYGLNAVVPIITAFQSRAISWRLCRVLDVKWKDQNRFIIRHFCFILTQEKMATTGAKATKIPSGWCQAELLPVSKLWWLKNANFILNTVSLSIHND